MPKKFDLETKQAMQNEVLKLHCQGNTISSICRMKNMPSRESIYAWMIEDEHFAKQFARAREMAMDAIADEAMRIADTQLEGEIFEESKDGVKITRQDMLGHRKLQIETRLKLLAKWAPKKYGDKLDLTTDGKSFIQNVVVNDSKTAEDIKQIEG